MAKTTIENNQNLIIEGCYIPFGWRSDFSDQYLEHIHFLCLAFTDGYIDKHFSDIKAHGSDIEARLDDSYCTVDNLKEDNRRIISGFKKPNERVTLIESDYERVIDSLIIELKA